jgi:hypothetical protein
VLVGNSYGRWQLEPEKPHIRRSNVANVASQIKWCDYMGHVDPINGKRPNHVRCPKCRRRVIPQTVFDTHEYVFPRHKIPHSKR